MDRESLIEAARDAASRAYAPYSGFSVGAALLTRDGKVYTGCNIENSSYSATLCAERVAISKAISAGERDLQAIAVVGGNGSRITPPCGVCRQVMSEVCDPATFEIVLSDNGNVVSYTLAQLRPLAFGAEDISDDDPS
ncbi:MAG: cytidine deaminase [Clostridia bacterium]|nr:cytidine deaminase [Clostridia bacterium]